MRIHTFVGIVITLAAGAANSFGGVIDFEDQPTQNFATPIVSDGFSFSFGPVGWLIGPGPLAGFSLTDDGTSRLNSVGSPQDVGMTATDSHLFSIQQLDAATANTTDAPGTIVLTGHLFGGGAVTQTLDITPTFQTFSIDPGFTGLTSVDFVSTSLSLDNIQVDAPAAAPEPSTFAMLAMVVAGFAFRRKFAQVRPR
jgi:hypothetical protein